MRLVVLKLDEGYQKFEISVSPKMDMIINILEVLKTQNHGIGNEV